MPTQQTTSNVNPKPTTVLDETKHETEDPSDLVVMQDNEAIASYARDLAFMSEAVEVMIMDTQNPNDTTRLATISNNGKPFYFFRNQWRKCPRFVLEQLARAKRESWNFSYKKNSDGSTSDINQANQILRYPHQHRDKNPKGVAWYESIRTKSM